MTHVRNGRFYGLLALAGLVWGLQPLFVKFVVAELTPTTLTALRYSCITLLLFVLAALRGIPLPPRRDCLLLLVFMGLTGVAFNYIAQFSGLQYSSVGNATLIGATTPASTALLAAIFLREKLLPIEWLGIGFSLLGTLFLVTHESLDMRLSISFNRGDLLFFACQQGGPSIPSSGCGSCPHVGADRDGLGGLFRRLLDGAVRFGGRLALCRAGFGDLLAVAGLCDPGGRHLRHAGLERVAQGRGRGQGGHLPQSHAACRGERRGAPAG